MKKRGFTVTEIMLATSIFGMVMAGTLSVFFVANRSWFSGDIQMRCAREADMILQRMTYGGVGVNGLRSAIFTNVAVGVTGAQWSVTYNTPDGGIYNFAYDPSAHVIRYSDLVLSNNPAVTIGENVRTSTVSVITNGLDIMVQVGLVDGRFAATNTMTTYIRYRN